MLACQQIWIKIPLAAAALLDNIVLKQKQNISACLVSGNHTIFAHALSDWMAPWGRLLG